MGNNSFLDAIISNPDDDYPRLVYADYLCDRGDPQGQFIRKQIQTGDVEHVILTHTEQPSRRPPQTRIVGNAIYRRGFIDQMECHADQWFSVAYHHAEVNPIQRVILSYAQEFSEIVFSPLSPTGMAARLGRSNFFEIRRSAYLARINSYMHLRLLTERMEMALSMVWPTISFAVYLSVAPLPALTDHNEHFRQLAHR